MERDLEPASQPVQKLTVASMDFANLDLPDVKKFEALVVSNQPTLVVMHGLAPLCTTYIKDSAEIKKNYYLLECPKVERNDDRNFTSMIIIRIGTQCAITQLAKPESGIRINAHLEIGAPLHSSLRISIISLEPCSSKSRWNFLQTVIKPPPPKVISETLLISDLTDGITNMDEAIKETRNGAGYMDAFDAPTGPWTLWLRSPKFVFCSPVCEIRHDHPRYISATIIPRSGAASAAVSIPVPRSATGSKSPVAGGQSLPVPDPAVVSVESSMQASNRGDGKHKRPLRSWRLRKRFEHPNALIQQEVGFDLSSYFSKEEELYAELDSGRLEWPAEFCYINKMVLCSDNVSSVDRQAFRKYARDTKDNGDMTALMQEAISRWLTKYRARQWSENCCTIVYQITPKEMRYNITRKVGLGPENLKTAIKMLNRSVDSSKENPLMYYPYNYALLYSVERQGFWLIAERHVPCDIVACRQSHENY